MAKRYARRKSNMLNANSFVYGTYTAKGIKCKEASLGGLVPRVMVNQSETGVSNMNFKKSFQGRKRKIDQLSPQTSPKSRVRSRLAAQEKMSPENTRSKRKFNFQTNLRPLTAEGVKVKSGKDKRFNGLRSSRVRKPSSRLSDFVLESSRTIEPAPPKVIKAKPVSAPIPEKDKSIDPLDISGCGDDVVHSFLPVFKKKPVVQYRSPKFKIKYKENKQAVPNNIKTRAKVQKASSPSSTPVVKEEPKVESPVESSIEAQVKKVSDKVEVQSMSEKLQQKLKSLPGKIKPTYKLVITDPPPPPKKFPIGSGMDFNKLVRSLKLVKLPGPKWKIRIVVSKQQTITEVTFTNKEIHERCIKFSRVFSGYVISFSTDVVKLLGAPANIASFNDVTILLDIIHNIEINDPILEFEKDLKAF